MFKLYFFEAVGNSRYWAYLRQNIGENGTEKELTEKESKLDQRALVLLKRKLLDEGFDENSSDVTANARIDSAIVEWGRKPQIPTLIEDLVQQAKKN